MVSSSGRNFYRDSIATETELLTKTTQKDHTKEALSLAGQTIPRTYTRYANGLSNVSFAVSIVSKLHQYMSLVVVRSHLANQIS